MQPTTDKMEYRYLGNSGLKVSLISLGNFINNEDDSFTEKLLKFAMERGINYFDTAEIYDLGRGEETFGKALKKLNVPREKIVVSTKMFRIGDGPNDSLLSRKHIIEGTKNSLKRLQLDYVDIIFCHRYDMHTPLEETCRAMNFLIDHGLAFYWGTSEWTAGQIMEAMKICEKNNLCPPIVEQCEYNMINRERFENEYRDLFKKHRMGTTIWSPLYGGVLSGKYINETPNDSRFVKFSNKYNMVYVNNKKMRDEKMLKLKEIGEKKLKCTLPQLCIAWTLANTDVSTCITGASKISQLEETIEALNLYKKIDKETMIEIEKVLQNTPVGEVDHSTLKQLPSRRNILLGIEYP